MHEDGFREPTADERTARRILSMAIGLTNARLPRTTSDIREDFYPDLSEAAFKKAFRRDRERLETCGIHLKEAGRRGRQATWCVDEERSYASEGALSADDALALDFLLAPLASDPTFPYARDLRLALAKIDRCFDGTSQARVAPEARARNNYLTRIEECLVERKEIEVDYERASGERTKRRLAPYGLFTLNGYPYMVAVRTDMGEDAPPHTYNLERLHALKEIPGSHYELPADFDVRDFERLPFQLGETRFEATFVDPVTSEVRSHEGADADVAAAWAIAEGLVPTGPEEVVTSWRERLLAFASGGEQA